MQDATHPAKGKFQLILHLLALQTVVPAVLALIGMRDMRSLFAVRGQTDSTYRNTRQLHNEISSEKVNLYQTFFIII